MKPVIPHWEHFPHGADVGVRGIGPTMAAAFEQAACAMTAAVTDLDSIAARERIELACTAPDNELLLMEWLNSLVYEMATRRMLFHDFTVEIDNHALTGVACGEPVDTARHQPAVEVKGATVTALEVARAADGLWHAQCVVDV